MGVQRIGFKATSSSDPAVRRLPRELMPIWGAFIDLMEEAFLSLNSVFTIL
jgi:hypothetical protein